MGGKNSTPSEQEILVERIRALKITYPDVNENCFLKISSELNSFLESEHNNLRDTKNTRKGKTEIMINLVAFLAHVYHYAEKNKFTVFSGDDYQQTTFGDLCSFGGITLDQLGALSAEKEQAMRQKMQTQRTNEATINQHITDQKVLHQTQATALWKRSVIVPTHLFNEQNILRIIPKQQVQSSSIHLPSVKGNNFEDVSNGKMDSTSDLENVFNEEEAETRSNASNQTVETVVGDHRKSSNVPQLLGTVQITANVNKNDRRSKTKGFISAIVSECRMQIIDALIQVIDGSKALPDKKNLALKMIYALVYNAAERSNLTTPTIMERVLQEENISHTNNTAQELLNYRISARRFNDESKHFTETQKVQCLCELVTVVKTKPHYLFSKKKSVTDIDSTASNQFSEMLSTTFEQLMRPMLTPLCKFYIDTLRQMSPSNDTGLNNAERCRAISTLLADTVITNKPLDEIIAHNMSPQIKNHLEEAAQQKTLNNVLTRDPAPEEQIEYMKSVSYFISKHPHYLLNLPELDTKECANERVSLSGANTIFAQKLANEAVTLETIQAANDNILAEGDESSTTGVRTPSRV